MEPPEGGPAALALSSGDEFEAAVARTDMLLVAFGANWCPWSQRLAPVFEVRRWSNVVCASRREPALLAVLAARTALRAY